MGGASSPRLAVDSGARVQYDGWRDRLTIQSPSGSLEIRSRWRNTMFPWRGRVYRVGSMLGNRGPLFRGGEPVAVGRIRWGGGRLGVMAPELRDFDRERALGFG